MSMLSITHQSFVFVESEVCITNLLQLNQMWVFSGRNDKYSWKISYLKRPIKVWSNFENQFMVSLQRDRVCQIQWKVDVRCYGIEGNFRETVAMIWLHWGSFLRTVSRWDVFRSAQSFPALKCHFPPLGYLILVNLEFRIRLELPAQASLLHLRVVISPLTYEPQCYHSLGPSLRSHLLGRAVWNPKGWILATHQDLAIAQLAKLEHRLWPWRWPVKFLSWWRKQ